MWLVVFVGWACAAEESPEAIPATHAQERLITVVSGAGEKLTTFAVDADGRVLAGVAKDTPVIRVYGPSGERTAEWKLPIPPEAINVGPKGDIFVAGQGVLLRLDDTGDVKLEKQSPNMAIAGDAAKEIQRRVQDKRSRAVSTKQQDEIKMYKRRLAEMQQKIADLDRDLFALDQRDLEKPLEDEAEEIEAERTKLQKRRAVCSKLQSKLELNVVNPPSQRRLAARRPPAGREPAPPEPEVGVRQLIANQMRIASISASRDEVFFACSSSTGSGFDVWRTSYTFTDAKKIGEGLRGCCGQLDVQANDNGIYVAENTRHRVRGFSRDGRQLLEFGSRERGRDDTFDGCCNPMNVAFGDDGSVYTAESGSGRVKRFSSNGTFMQLVGQVELVPGCKKVSIAVSPRGDRVYMLDITRGHIVVMSRGSSKAAAVVPADETTIAALPPRDAPSP
jgi:sugar lactone lactonase YvrE